ncbi:hypothetical protein R1flu_016889 [Riccia fluitans]|uniref:Uncharacterized protein n=1 Tax=Riccia fluitans TaxID=41844 RepID=A0ABD1YNE1_9MARC
MTSDHLDLSGEVRWSNLAKRCPDGDVRGIQQPVYRNEGVNMVGKVTAELRTPLDELKPGRRPRGVDWESRGSRSVESLISSQGRDDTEVLDGSQRKLSVSKAGELLSSETKISTCEGSIEKHTQATKQKGIRKDLSVMAQELLELRLHMIKEEERFRLQEQNLLLKQGLRYKTQTKGVQPEHEKSKAQREQRRKQRSPLRNQTNLIIDDLKGKVAH